MTTIKAIETRYAGCRFRSRLEARWAVFFDHMKMRWEYEPQGFELTSGRYLPDFWLPSESCWVEVKGADPLPEDLARCLEFAVQQYPRETATGGAQFMLLKGEIPRPPVNGIQILSYEPTDPITWHPDEIAVTDSTPLAPGDEVYSRTFGLGEVLSAHSNEFGLVADIAFSEGGKRLAVRHANLTKVFWNTGAELKPFIWTPSSTRIDYALTAARSARFEHGERGYGGRIDLHVSGPRSYPVVRDEERR